MWSKITNTLKSHTTNKPQPAISEDSESSTFFDRPNRSHKPAFWIPPSIKRSSLNPRSSRPTVGEIFSFLNTDNFGGSANNLDASSSLSNPVLVPGHDSTNLFDVSQQLDMSSFPSSGPDFDIAPTFPLDSSVNEHSKFLSDHGDNYPHQMSSTRYQPKDLKGKGNAIENEESREDVQVTVPKVVQETINHTKEKSPKLPPPHRERSQSFNFVPTVFYSVTNSGTKADKTSPDNVIVASSTKHMPASSESQRALPTSTSAKTRSRSMSSLMLHSSFSLSRSSQADINDESTTGIVLYSGSTPEPDPFGAHANTYYTPQTMIPPTPPLKHARKTSKEENQIISSQTQLTPQTELCHLCGRCEVALKSRDELIGILNKKLADVEKDDTKRKNALRSWKKKVQELERVCRQLEETVEESRQESLGRSVIDEASNEALRMLHRQIASLHREKNEWLNREQGLREEVRTLESLVEGRKGMGWEQTAALEKQNADLKAERDALRADVEELEARTSAMAVERNKSEKKGNELTTELQEMWNLKDALEKERDELKDIFQQSQEQAAQLDHDLQERDSRVSELERERQFAKDNVSGLEGNLRARDAEISQVTQQRDSEIKNLHEEMSAIKREYTHLINEQTKALRDAAGQEDESKARVDQLVRAKAEADVELKTSRDRIIVLKEEIERLRRLVHSLQQKSADKEVKIVQMTKQHSLDKEGLNIALDSKQQDLELLKRKIGVKDTAGSTPAQPSKVAHRREPSISTAIPVLSRSSSVRSDSGIDTMHVPKKERMISSEMAPPLAKLQALGKSTQVNGSVMRAGINGLIMRPPSLRSRPSIIGTPTPSAKGPSTKAFLARPAITTSTFSHKGSSVNSEHKVTTKIPRVAVASTAPSILDQDEKENVGDSSFKPETKHDTHTPLINHASRFIVPN